MTQNSEKPWQLVMLIIFDLAILILLSDLQTHAASPCAEGERVAQVQSRLHSYGYYGGEINGAVDYDTLVALRSFQSDASIEESGKIDYETLTLLGIGASDGLCFTHRAELLARCIEQSRCTSYPEMLLTGIEILSNGDCAVSAHSEALTLRQIIAVKPSSEAFSAAVQAIRLCEDLTCCGF